MPVRSQFTAENIPFRKDLIYLTKDGRKLCATDAERYVQHMVRNKVNGYTSAHKEICDKCGVVL